MSFLPCVLHLPREGDVGRAELGLIHAGGLHAAFGSGLGPTNDLGRRAKDGTGCGANVGIGDTACTRLSS